MGLSEQPDPEPFPQLDGIEFLHRIGRGGMGTVYLARQLDLQREVAVKRVSPGLSQEPEFIERLTREARLMAGLRHPHIVVVHQLARTGSGEMAIIMEHIPGGNLRDLLRRHPQGLPLEIARRVLRESASALAAAHALGVIHRDVKPENILLDLHGSAHIADFGLALRPDESVPRLTATSSTAGTLDYMAPERLESGDVDVRSDIYALGVVAYEMLTGKVPRGSFPPPHRLRAGIPAYLGEAVMKALRPDPAARFTTIAEFSTAVEGLEKASRRSWIAGAAASMALGAGAWFAIRPRDSRPPGSASLPGGWNDFLAAAKPAEHTISGAWHHAGNTLVSDPAISILAQEIDLPDDYDIRMSFTRLSGVHSVAVFLTANGSTGTVDIDGWGEGLSGLQAIDGRDLRQGGGFRFPLQNGREHLLEIQVRGGRIRISLDAAVKSETSFGPRSLGVVFPWQWTPPVGTSFLGIGSYESPTRFHRCEWRAASGG